MVLFRIAPLIAIFGACALLACSGPRTTRCADGTLCPAGTVCDSAHSLCVEADQIEACDGRSDGAPCVFGEIVGVCDQAVCFGDVCGDGFAHPEEVCDDGNTAAGDGCSSDCRSDESCGNAIVDLAEQCDCGDGTEVCAAPNSDVAGALCRSDCALHCGDGVRNSAETCDGDDIGTSDCVDSDYSWGRVACNAVCGLSEDRCYFIDWRDSGPPIPTASLSGIPRSIWAEPGFVAVADDGGRVHWLVEGVWSTAGAPEGAALNGVSGISATDVFAVGESGTAIRFDGLAWAATTTGTSQTLRGVWASPELTVAVGDGGTVIAFDGTSWTPLSSPSSSDLLAIAGTSATNLWAAGDAGTVLHFDGTDWSEQSPGTIDDFRAVAVSPSGVVYAVGDSVQVFDGTWREEPLSTPSPLNIVAARDSFAIAASDIRFFHRGPGQFEPMLNGATGARAIASVSPETTLAVTADGRILEYNGAFTKDRKISLGTVRDAAAADGSRIVAVGVTQSAGRVGIDNGGGGFSFVDVPRPLNGVWLDANGDGFAVGDAGFIASGSASGSWAGAEEASVALNAVSGAAIDDAFAVGSLGVILRRDADSWDPIPSGTTAALFDVDVVSADFAVAVGAGGTALHWNGTAWSEALTPTDAGLMVVWAASEDFALAGGRTGLLLAWDGVGWDLVDLGTSESVTAIGGSSATDVLVATESETLFYFDGSTWTKVHLGTSSHRAVSFHGTAIHVVNRDVLGEDVHTRISRSVIVP